ncbi:amidohydrolase family protein [Ruania halotolerans]|uniref:amidohydrolase family protein n=1 Tax=Ruania halotolerans TaxID=2897773 RepID=UPI001E630C84|nr:amidohydrolase family protein [Ruania halotolerans]UFU07042.1 amidohydrolase family protein [Ruania halotolerans]
MNAMMPVGSPSGGTDLAGMRVATVRGVRLLDGTFADLTLAGGTIVAAEPAGLLESGQRAGPAAGPGAGAVLGAPDLRTTDLRTTDLGPTGRGATSLDPSSLDATTLNATDLDETGRNATDLDATGWRYVPAASEPHAHLDKALTAPRIPAGAGYDLVGAIEAWRAIVPAIDAGDITTRARAAVGRYLAQGITTVRTHVDAPLTGDPLRGVDAMVALREELRGTLTLQVCLLAGSLTPDAVVAEAVARGIDVIGGCPHLADDPRHETARMLDLAEHTGLPVDLHTDEQVSPDPAHTADIIDLAQQVIARGLIQRVSASHCVRLGSLPPDRLAPVLELVARARIGIITLPITNLYLQAWDATHLPPRGLTAVRQILDAGIDLAAGADNLRDPFNPVGRADPFETTSLLITAGHLQAEEALAAVTTSARTVLGLPPVGAAPGASADFMLVPDADLGDVIAGGTTARVVVSGGRVVADTRVRTSLDHPALMTEPHHPAALIGR